MPNIDRHRYRRLHKEIWFFNSYIDQNRDDIHTIYETAKWFRSYIEEYERVLGPKLIEKIKLLDFEPSNIENFIIERWLKKEFGSHDDNK